MTGFLLLCIAFSAVVWLGSILLGFALMAIGMLVGSTAFIVDHLRGST